jgi:PAS domain S-box-containing protein
LSTSTAEHTILFIDGPSLDRDRIVRVFREGGVAVPVAFVGTEEGIDRALRQSALAVFVHQRPAGGDGLDVIRKIRDLGSTIPLIMLVDTGNEEVKLAALREDADEFARYPEDLAALPVVLERAVTRRRRGPDQVVRERAIVRSQEQWMAIFDAITDYVFVLDAQGRFVKVNRACAGSLGLHPRELIGKPCAQFLGPEASSWDCAADAGAGAAVPTTCEKRVGQDMYQISVFPLREAGRALTIHFMKNVTEIKRLKDQLYHADKLASLGLLVSGVAHEINNPLTGTIAYTELLRMTVTDEKILGELRKISDSAERCKRIVDNLLTFSRQRTPSKSVESMNDVIDRAIELRSYWLRSSNIEIVRDYDAVTTVFVDSQQIQQVVLNVLLNAEQAIAGAGVKNGRIVFSTRYDRENRKVAVAITNNGPAIPEAVLTKMFDPFFTTKPVGVGTGLGLSISHGIITEHGGTIRAENLDSEGVRFIIEIPTGAEGIVAP